MNEDEVLSEIDSLRIRITYAAPGEPQIENWTIALVLLYDYYVKLTKGRGGGSSEHQMAA